MARILCPINADDLRADYNNGTSVLALAKKHGVCRNVVVRWLMEAGCKIRNRSEGMYTRMAKATPEERQALSAAAHDAVRGMKRTHDELVKRALRQSRDIGFGEVEIADACRDRGWEVDPQWPVDVYNIDVGVDKRVAVEVSGHGARISTLTKMHHLSDLGLVPVYVLNASRVEGRNVNHVVALIDLLRRKEPVRGEYWVIRCHRDGTATLEGYGHNRASVPAPKRSEHWAG